MRHSFPIVLAIAMTLALTASSARAAVASIEVSGTMVTATHTTEPGSAFLLLLSAGALIFRRKC